MAPPSRPPGQYVVAPGTQYCLVANEYDKNTYSQCTYVSQRTLVRCKQIRSKEELTKNGGKCEEHDEFCKLLKANHSKELLRVKSECDNIGSKKRNFSSFIVTNDYISDEDEWVQPGNRVSSELPDQIYDNTIDDHHLRHAGTYTEKDVARIRRDMIRHDLTDLYKFRDLLEAHAVRTFERYNYESESSEKVLVDFAEFRALDSSNHYGRRDYLKVAKSNPKLLLCLAGHDFNDDDVIMELVDTLITQVEGKPVYAPIKQPCQNDALDGARYCIDHIFMDKKQVLFQHCSICGDVAFGSEDPTCAYHRKEFIEHRRAKNRKNEERMLEKSGGELTRYQAQFMSKYLEIDSSDDEKTVLEKTQQTEPKLANLTKIEQMGSPLPPLSSVAYLQSRGMLGRQLGGVMTSPTAAVGTVLRNQLGLKDPYHHQQTAAQRVVAAAMMRSQEQMPLMHQQGLQGQQQPLKFQATAQRHPVQQQKEEQYGCARERIFHPSQFKKSETALGKKTMTRQAPRVLSSSSSAGGPAGGQAGPSTSGIRSNYQPATLGQWHLPTNRNYGGPSPLKNQQMQQQMREQRERMTSQTYHTRYPLPNVPPQSPKPIPLERETGGADTQLSNDAFPSNSIRYPRLSNDTPRGIPYVKQGSTFHRQQQAAAAAVASTAPTVTPQVTPPRPIVPRPRMNLPPPPHRMKGRGVPVGGVPPPPMTGTPSTSTSAAVPSKVYQPQVAPANLASSSIPGGSSGGVGCHPGRYSTLDMSRIANDSRLADVNVKTFLKVDAAMRNFSEDDVEKVLDALGKQPNISKSPQKKQQLMTTTSPIRDPPPPPPPSAVVEEEKPKVEDPEEEKKEEAPASATRTPRVRHTNISIVKKRKASTPAEDAGETKPKQPKIEERRTPRAAAIAAKQAINKKSGGKGAQAVQSPPPPAAAPAQMEEEGIRNELSEVQKLTDPLSVLAAVSEIERQKGEKDRRSMSAEDLPKASTSETKVTPSASAKKTSVARRRSSRGKGEAAKKAEAEAEEEADFEDEL